MGSKIFKIGGINNSLTALRFEFISIRNKFESRKFESWAKLVKSSIIVTPILLQFPDISKILKFRILFWISQKFTLWIFDEIYPYRQILGSGRYARASFRVPRIFLETHLYTRLISRIPPVGELSLSRLSSKLPRVEANSRILESISSNLEMDPCRIHFTSKSRSCKPRFLVPRKMSV